MRPVKDWQAVSGWISKLADPAAEVTEPVRAKALELTSGAKTDWEKIRAIAQFVQKTNYVAVSTNITHAGGYTPHPAAYVLERNYGDCKDKTALMRALLKAVGIESYDVSVEATERESVAREWPSPHQFNHSIIAIRAGNGIDAPTVIDHPRLGRLLIFDPTSEFTPVGDLPYREQGSQALIGAGEQGELVPLPYVPDREESAAEAELKPDGSLGARVQGRYLGQEAVPLRAATHSEERDAVKHIFERALSQRLGGLTIDKLDVKDRPEEGRLEVDLSLAANHFGQLLQDRLLVVTPGSLAPGSGYAFPAKPRTQPVRLEPRRQSDTTVLSVPAQFKVDEIPDPVKIESPYGLYQADWKAEGSRIRFEQKLELKHTLAPPAEYGAIREFFERVNGAGNSAVVLVKQ